MNFHSYSEFLAKHIPRENGPLSLIDRNTKTEKKKKDPPPPTNKKPPTNYAILNNSHCGYKSHYEHQNNIFPILLRAQHGNFKVKLILF